ncbi:MAG: threonine--tRNA ligase, partial [Campylobacter sp.]|nr:threonine--tRNA ligase [Campylobacter sp.]
MSDIIAYKLGEEIIDTQSYAGSGEPIYFDNSNDALDVIRHSAAHLLAAAVKSLYKDAKFFVGPAIEDGFYYDMRVIKPDGEKLGEEDLKIIEEKMKELAKNGDEIIKINSTKAEVSAKYANDDLKQEVLKRIPDGAVSLYRQGEFEDICRGPH